MFVRWDDYVATVEAANPDARGVLPSAIGVAPVNGLSPDALAGRINDASEQADALTRQSAADNAPGVSEVKSSFQIIFLLFGLVVPLVTGLFFLIVTLQKSASLTLLRAIGAPSGVLVGRCSSRWSSSSVEDWRSGSSSTPRFPRRRSETSRFASISPR